MGSAYSGLISPSGLPTQPEETSGEVREVLWYPSRQRAQK